MVCIFFVHPVVCMLREFFVLDIFWVIVVLPDIFLFMQPSPTPSVIQWSIPYLEI
jgi:hypothetical protein